ncbi:unnamed protein product [Allacma fusca]|uniref:Uncharacterized protein n=1 Tax=Allacma fusca TaxID=39272 RepID=A0A8J2NTJ0_9HEXA|nr:unnamed protein product [Allacma fusca]
MYTRPRTFFEDGNEFLYQIYATMASFYIPLCVMVVVYAKILRVVTDKKKEMNWKKKSCSLPGHFQRTPSLSTTSGTDARRNQIQMSQIRNIVVTSKPTGATITSKLTPRTSLDVGLSEGGDRRLSSETHQQKLPDQKDDNTEDEEDAAQRARRSLLPCISIPVPPRKKRNKNFITWRKFYGIVNTLLLLASTLCFIRVGRAISIKDYEKNS